MAHIANEWLEKYEIKKPDYDYIDRDYIGMSDVTYDSARYVKNGDSWKSKKVTRKLFGKKHVKLMFVGDITCFEKQFEEAQQGKDYDFSYEFEKVQPLFAEADLVVGNLETMIFPNAPYRTEKYVSEQNFHCNAPIEFLDAIRKAGIDVLTNANNHDLDTGAVGIGETIDHVERFGFIQTGTFKSDKKRYEIIDVDGFKIAIVAFATEHNNKECNLTVEGADFLLNNYSKEKAANIIEAARKDGAELVFTCIHWGKENKLVHNEEQTEIATELAEMGYDCIIGSHPHVLQPFSTVEANGKKVPVFYSMGNFISHNANNAKARSIIACVDLERRGKNIEITCSYIPVFTSKSFGDKKYIVLPIKENTLNLKNAKKLMHIKKVVGNEIKIDNSIKYEDYSEKKDKSASKKKKAQEINLAKVKEFPFTYDDTKFTYIINRDEAILTGVSEECTTSSYTVPETILDLPITSVEEAAFAGNQIMKKMNFRKNVRQIKPRLFKDCKMLEGFQLAKTTKEIGEEAFAGCESLSAAVMKNGVKKIGPKAFAGCTNLRSVKIGPNVSEISDDAFEGCTRAVFYCEADSYAEKYANDHGFKVLNMKLF